VRVVGGEWRGRRLAAPSGRATRPTSDKVREAVFDALEAMIAKGEAGVRGDRAEAAGTRGGNATAGPLGGVEVLDLFAGSGALGLEALSRGAEACTFVERGVSARAALRANLVALGVGLERARLVQRDFRAALKADAREGRRYDLVFVDAPYDQYRRYEPHLAQLLGRVLATGGVVVVESGGAGAIGLPLAERSVRRYGDTRVTYLTAD